MAFSAETDIISFLKKLLTCLQPFAKKKNISLYLAIEEKEIRLPYAEEELHTGFTKLITSIIDYMPDNNSIYLNAGVTSKEGDECISVKIRNTGINLKIVSAITKNSILPVALLSSELKETTFEVSYNLDSPLNEPVIKNGSVINYISFVKGVKNQFHWINNPLAWLSQSKPNEAVNLLQI